MPFRSVTCQPDALRPVRALRQSGELVGFREYFLEQADFADDAHERGLRINCHMAATAAIDALAAIWESDFPGEAKVLQRDAGGKPPASVRMARFVSRFTRDERAERVAVIRFCEDARPYADAQTRTELEALLGERTPKTIGQLPPAYKDLTVSALAERAPMTFAKPGVSLMAEEYRYPALLYTLYRCPTVHALSYPKQAQGFAVDEEVFYMRLHDGFTSIGFGHKLLTNWLRDVANGYVDYCAEAAIEPGRRIDPGADQEARLAGKWKKILS